MKELFIAKTFAGLEEILAQELKDLQIEDVELLNRAVSFRGSLKDLYTANYWCRTALRILKPIAEFPSANENELYKGISAINWSDYLSLEDTFAIDATISKSNLNHTQYAALKTKDAIADQFVRKFGKRPDVETTRPTLRISIFIQFNKCIVSLDSSNISLNRRGYRKNTGAAPLNEALAAGMILLSGWDKKSHFIDPMCGSGTLLIEAALIAMNIPPASYRDYFGFQSWKDFNAELWKEVKLESIDKQQDIDFKIIGTDLASGMITVAQNNIQSAHLQHDIEIHQIAMQEFTPPKGPGVLVCNPPYGERIRTRDIVDLYREVGDTLKQKYHGYSAWIISSDIIALKQLGLYPTRKIELFNGPLECRFERFDIYEGSQKEKYLNLKSAENADSIKSNGPSYRKKEDWDKEGSNTKFKGKTKSEWDEEAEAKKKAKKASADLSLAEKRDSPKKRYGDSERKKGGDYPKKRYGDSERKEGGDYPKKRYGDSERKEGGDYPKKRYGDSERKEGGDYPKKRYGDSERKEVGDYPKKRYGDSERKEVGDYPKKRYGNSERKEVGDYPKKRYGNSERKEGGDYPKKRYGFSERKEGGDYPKKRYGDSERKEGGDYPKKRYGDSERKEGGDYPKKRYGDSERKEGGDYPKKRYGDSERKEGGDYPKKRFGESNNTEGRPFPKKRFGESSKFGDSSKKEKTKTTTFYPKGRAPRKRIPKKSDNT